MIGKRTQREVDSVLGDCADSISEGSSKYPGLTYEEGVQAALDWILGNTDDQPMAE